MPCSAYCSTFIVVACFWNRYEVQLKVVGSGGKVVAGGRFPEALTLVASIKSDRIMAEARAHRPLLPWSPGADYEGYWDL